MQISAHVSSGDAGNHLLYPRISRFDPLLISGCVHCGRPFVVLGIEADCRRAHDNIVIARLEKPSNVDNITVEHLSASVMNRAISRRGLLEPDNRPNVVKKLEFQAAQYAAFGGRRRWISPRFSSLLFSLCCLAAAVGTAVDAGTEGG